MRREDRGIKIIQERLKIVERSLRMKLDKEVGRKEEEEEEKGGGGRGGGGGGCRGGGRDGFEGGGGKDYLPRGRTRGRAMSHVVSMHLSRFAPIGKLLVVAILLLFSCATRFARASEFPERECCVFPIPEPTGRSTAAPIPTGRSGSDIKKGVAILNCLYARQLCFEDPSCSAILEIIPRVCGPELVACSTVTVTKCRSALHSLQAFSFFRPTCLCKERHVDPDCNSFQNFLFDHPCIDVQKKDKEQHPVEPLPTCTHAMNECLRAKLCNQILENFKNSCKAREGKCRMESRDTCHDSWTQLRLSTVFGCVCPNNHVKKRCDRIFSLVNHNPCVEYLPSSASIDLSGTDSALYPFDPQQESYQEIWLPPTSMYPYFLFPGTARTSYHDYEIPYEGQEQGRHRQHGHRHQSGRHQEESERSPKPNVFVVDANDPKRKYLNKADPRFIVTDDEHLAGQLNLPGSKYGDRRQKGAQGDVIFKDFDGSSSSSNIHSMSSYPSFPSSSSSSFSSSSSSSSSDAFSKHDRASNTVHLQPRHSHQSEHDAHPHHHHHHQHQQHHHNHNQHNYYYHHPAPAPSPTSSSSSSLSSLSSSGFSSSSSLSSSNAHPPRPTPTVDETKRIETPQVAPPKKFAPRPTYEHRAIVDRVDDDLDDIEFRIGALPVDRLFDLREAFEGFVDQVKVISHPDNSTSFEVIESQVENPLIDADHQDLLAMKQIPVPGDHHHRTHRKKNQTIEENDQALPSAKSEIDKIQQPPKLILPSTCHHAYTSCKNDPECKELLQPVLKYCGLTSCTRNECMTALQHFYKTANHKHSIEIAFCLCRKIDGRKDECIIAQEKMHPACAQRVEGVDMPTCHSLAEICKKNEACRTRLERYEQSCAVDSVTKKCAGPPSDCRKAMLGILGTELRSNCACKGTDFTQLYDCLGWQRLLWVNPCVVESQKDYHVRRKHHHYTRTTPIGTTPSTATTIITSSSAMRTHISMTATTTVTAVERVEDNQLPEVTRWPTTEPTETLEITTNTVSTTPSTTTTTTTPPRFCVVQRPRQSHQYIREGKGKRLYREDEPECSELCQCSEGEVLICNTICVDSSPCKTDFAYYNHEAPAYQAHRGPCLCYSGGFICMRPSPGAYSIPHGVFMFLGYSEKDETLLRPHNNLTVLDAVSSLDSFMREEVNNQTVCTLFLYNVTRENVIAVARLGTDNPPLNSSQAQSLQHLLRVKEECASMLEDLSSKINNKHHEVHTHPLLSIFKMAEVAVKLPYSNGGKSVSRSSSSILLLVLLAYSIFASISTYLIDDS